MASAELLLADCPWHSGKDNLPDLEYNLPTSYGKIAFLKNYPDAATISAHIVGSLSILFFVSVCPSVSTVQSPDIPCHIHGSEFVPGTCTRGPS